MSDEEPTRVRHSDARSDDANSNDTHSDVPTEQPRPELAPQPLRVSDRTAEVGAVALRVTLVVVGVFIVLLLAYQLQVLLLMLVIALILASAMHAPALFLERRGLPRIASVALSYLALIAVVLGAFAIVARPLFSEVDTLTDRGPELIESLRQQAVGVIDNVAGEGTGEEFVGSLTGALSGMDLAGAISVPVQIAGILVNLLFIVFLSALLVMERDRARGWLLPFVAPQRRDAAADVAQTVFTRLGRFVHGQLLVMTVVATGVTVALVVIGVPFALPLGLLTFIAEAIPLLGPWIAGVPITLVAFATSPVTGVIVVIWLIVLQQLEGLVLTPMVQSKVQHLSPVVVLLSVLAGHQLFGVVGALIAVPVVSVAAIIVEAVIRPARERALARSDQAA